MLITDATHLPRLMNCNGSRLMSAAYPTVGDDPTARDEGNAAHWAAQQRFNGASSADMIAKRAFNGVIITAEMMSHVDEYLFALDHCGEMEAVTSFGGEGFEVKARCDHRFVSADLLIIDDFKYGHSLVEPEENWTLIAHAVGTCIQHSIAPATIILRIHQPRAHHPDGKTREWRINYDQLIGYHRQICATLGAPSDMLQTGAWCRRCHALATCPAARAASMNAIDAATLAFSDEVGNDILSFELDTLQLAKATIERRLTALEEMASHRIRSGEVVPFYSNEQRYANTQWNKEYSASFLTATTGINCVKEGVITPAEAVRRGMPEATMKRLTTRPLTGTKLVRVDPDKKAQRMLGKKED